VISYSLTFSTKYSVADNFTFAVIDPLTVISLEEYKGILAQLVTVLEEKSGKKIEAFYDLKTEHLIESRKLVWDEATARERFFEALKEDKKRIVQMLKENKSKEENPRWFFVHHVVPFFQRLCTPQGAKVSCLRVQLAGKITGVCMKPTTNLSAQVGSPHSHTIAKRAVLPNRFFNTIAGVTGKYKPSWRFGGCQLSRWRPCW